MNHTPVGRSICVRNVRRQRLCFPFGATAQSMGGWIAAPRAGQEPPFTTRNRSQFRPGPMSLRQISPLRLLLAGLLTMRWLPFDANAQFNPCNGKALLNEPCDRDSDCELKGSICLRQTCQCHPYYQMVRAEKGAQSRCVRLPAKVGQECHQKCREPLFCRGGRCQCVQRGSTQVVNGECVSTSRVGDRCSRHYDCTAPFSACVNHQCDCISGTVQQGSKCVAAANCPLGGSPSAECIRRAQPAQVANFVDDADNCPHGFFCVGTPDSPVGHCCPALCPLGTSVDHSYTCLPGGGTTAINTVGRELPPLQTAPAQFTPTFGRDPPSPSPLANITQRLLFVSLPSSLLPKQQCPSETHFCHYLSGDTFAQALCCKRPCNAMAPDSLYLNGECVSRGQLGSECKYHEQCGAAEGMACLKGLCQCIDGFSPASDVITHPNKNPSQQCVRDCDKGSSVSRDTSCLGKAQLGAACFVQEQCPEHSGCYRGRCLCRCGYRMTAQNKCVPVPPPSTPKPQTAQIVPSNPDIFGIFQQFIGGTAGVPMNRG